MSKTRESFIAIRVSEMDKKKIRKAAALYGWTVSTYCLNCISAMTEKVIKKEKNNKQEHE